LRHAQRAEKFLEENFARMGGGAQFRNQESSFSGIVSDLDGSGIAIREDDADATLIVGPHAVLTTSIALELLEAVPGRNTKVIDVHGSVDHVELSSRDRPEISRDLPQLPEEVPAVTGLSAIRASR